MPKGTRQLGVFGLSAERVVGELRLDGGAVDAEAQAAGVVTHLDLNVPGTSDRPRARQRRGTGERVALPGAEVRAGLRPGEAAVGFELPRERLEAVHQNPAETPLRLIRIATGAGELGVRTDHQATLHAGRNRDSQRAALQVAPHGAAVVACRTGGDGLRLQRRVGGVDRPLASGGQYRCPASGHLRIAGNAGTRGSRGNRCAQQGNGQSDHCGNVQLTLHILLLL